VDISLGQELALYILKKTHPAAAASDLPAAQGGNFDNTKGAEK
jgi:hypothetical protein